MYIESNIYFALWSKYRPVILQLMKASESDEQQYKLSGHEFKAVGDKTKSGYAFSLETQEGKVLKIIGRPTPARDLLLMLQRSKTGALLMSEASYELRLDKEFVFHVTRKPEEIPAVSSDAASEEDTLEA